MSDRKKLEQIALLLTRESTMALATTNAEGESCSTPLFYLAGEDLQLYWFSSSASVHSKNLRRDASAAVSIYHPTSNWKEICGAQMKGTVAVIKDRTLRKAITQTYAERFSLGAIFRTVISRSSLYVFRPAWIRYIDNARHFGHKFEVTLANDDTATEN
jgi:uncharacterized protein YhbP (UPF0306 family)